MGRRARVDVSPQGVAGTDRRPAGSISRWTAEKSFVTPWCGCRNRCAPCWPPPATPPEDLKLLLAHQANLRIAEVMQKDLRLRDDQVYNNIMWYGNTTAATIPIALDECVRDGRLQRGDLLVMTAFGSGFMWGSAAVRW